MAISRRLEKEVKMTGLTEILFDRYAGDNKTQLAPEQKMYLHPDGSNTLVLPALNILSFFTAKNTMSAPKLLLNPKEYGRVCDALLSSLSITPSYIPFLRNGKPIKFGAFIEDEKSSVLVDKTSGMTVVYHVARLDKGIPNPKVRPMLGLSWELKFNMSILPHPELNEDLIENLAVDGGQRLGLGTFRKMFGKFAFSWE